MMFCLLVVAMCSESNRSQQINNQASQTLNKMSGTSLSDIISGRISPIEPSNAGEEKQLAKQQVTFKTFTLTDLRENK